MKLFERFWLWIALKDKQPETARAQLEEIAAHLPMLHAVIVVNMGMAMHCFHVATGAAMAGGAIVSLALERSIRSMRATGRKNVAGTDPVALLHRITGCAVAIGLAHVVATIVAAGRISHADGMMLPFFIMLTVIGSTFCLMHLPQAAVLVSGVLQAPWIGYQVVRGDFVTAAMLTEATVVTAAMVHVLRRNFLTFTTLVQSRADLAVGRLEAERIGHTDSLTGLPNRRFFLARLDALVAEHIASDGRFAVGILDLDRFKPVNDTYGHVIGDRLLAQLGDRLLGICENTIVARLGGDEFGVLLLLENGDDAAMAGQRICELVAQPFHLDDLTLAIGCSGGLALFPDAGRSARELFDRSDYALYHGKLVARGGCTMFSAEHELLIRSGQVLETAIQTADLEREMSLHFQPIVDSHQMLTVGVEALARWDSPILGSVPPDRFVPVMEGLGTIGGLTLILFRKAIAQAADLPDGLWMSFNLSAHDIASRQTVDGLIDTLARAAFDPARITFEITETAAMRDFDATVAAIGRFRALGIRVALDDFGTGFSSLTHLRRLPLDYVKVDRSFAIDLHDESGDKIVAAIVALCRNLGLDCVIEGIERDDQLFKIRQLGYRHAQGYLFARPMPMERLIGWLAAGCLQDEQELCEA